MEEITIPHRSYEKNRKIVADVKSLNGVEFCPMEDVTDGDEIGHFCTSFRQVRGDFPLRVSTCGVHRCLT